MPSPTPPRGRASTAYSTGRITGQAYVIPWLWDNDIVLRAADVHGVVSQFTSRWDLTFTAVR